MWVVERGGVGMHGRGGSKGGRQITILHFVVVVVTVIWRKCIDSVFISAFLFSIIQSIST